MKITDLPSPIDAIAAGRLLEIVSSEKLLTDEPPLLRARTNPAPGLRLVFIVSRTAMVECRATLHQVNHLAALGASVTVVSHDSPPQWIELNARFRQVPFGEPLEDAIPACDLVVATHWEYVLLARQTAIAPVVHLEAGDFHLRDELPERVANLVGACVRSAHGTIAIGRSAAHELVRRFSVASHVINAGVDSTVFSPELPAIRSERRRVLVVGGDDEGHSKCDVSRVIAEIRDDADVRLLATRTERGDRRSAEIVACESIDDLVAAYRWADVCVVAAEGAFSLAAPLEAMAVGTPVVVLATDGMPLDFVDGTDALVAYDGRSLVEATRRALRDDALATALRGAGLQRAGAHAWPLIARELLSFYESHSTHPSAPPLGHFEVCFDDLRFVRAEDEELFERRLESSSASAIAIPVSQPAWRGHDVVRWQIVARRTAGSGAISRIYLPARRSEPVSDSPWQDGIDLLRAARHDEALAYFLAACRQHPLSDQVALGRWLVLALLEVDRAREALMLAVAFARDFPAHPDYLYLAVLAARAAGDLVDVAAPLEGIRLLGHGARYEEWFEAPIQLLSGGLLAA